MADFLLPESQNEPTALMHRRHVIGGLGLVGVGLVASAGDAFASPKVSVPTSASNSMGTAPAMRYEPASSPLAEVSRDWAKANAKTANDYLRYLNGLRLRRVNPEQLIAAHAKQRSNIWNGLPPKQWWNRMGYVLRVVDRLALEMNLDRVEVVSAYRTPAYNAFCGGRSRSWHQANVAVDVKAPVSASRFTKVARQLRDEGLFRGGVGGYSGFTHVDARGENVNW
jgi:Peptidase M15